MDFLASEGIDFTHAVSGYPLCCPFRGALLSGVYPHKSCPGHEMQMDPSRPTIAQPFRDAGYTTTWLGKWHLDAPYQPYVESDNNTADFAWNEWTSPERRHGFDFWHAYGTYDAHMRPMYWATDTPRDGAFYVDQWGPEYEADVGGDNQVTFHRRT